jgi:tetratricopeptide (TPR) repeat protein
LSAELIAQAFGFFERALARDPGNIEALVIVSFIDFYRATNLIAEDRATLLAAAETTLSKALSVAPEQAFAHAILGAVQIHTNRAAEGIAESERALALNPNLASAHAFVGINKAYIGRAEETGSSHQRSAPHQPTRYERLHLVGVCGHCEVLHW